MTDESTKIEPATGPVTSKTDGNPAPAPGDANADAAAEEVKEKPVERGGPKGLEPTRFGDWEKNGRCFDF